MATALPLPAVERFGVHVATNGAAYLAWSVRLATGVTLNGQKVAARGSIRLAHAELQQPTLWVLKATNRSGAVTQIAPLAPPLPLRISAVAPSQRVVAPAIPLFAVHQDPHSGSLTLTWRVRGADVIRLNAAPVAASGTQRVMPGGVTSYLLQASNGAGTTAARLVLPGQPPLQTQTVILRLPSIQEFTLVHSGDGRPFTLAWRTQNARAVTLNSRPVAPAGSQLLHDPVHRSTYILVARNQMGQVEARLAVAVQ
jgi:hypothetical protein